MKYLCERCIHIEVCFIPRSTGCVEECKHFKEMPNHLSKQTNEGWFCNLDTEDKAREISDMTAQGYWSEELVEKWLKDIHE